MTLTSASLILCLLLPSPPGDAPSPAAPELWPALLQDEAAAAKPAPKWTGSVNLGLFDATGNTERTSASLSADAVLRREKDRTTLGAFWSYASEETAGASTITERRVGGRAKYDYFLSEKSYALANASAENDKKALLQLRYTAGAGCGRQLEEEEDLKVGVEVGLNYFNEDFEGAAQAEYVAARLAYNVEWVPRESWKISQTAEVFPSLEDSDDVNTKLDTRARYDLNEAWFAQFQWVWDWDNTPAAGLERSDHRLFLTLGYSF